MCLMLNKLDDVEGTGGHTQETGGIGSGKSCKGVQYIQSVVSSPMSAR